MRNTLVESDLSMDPDHQRATTDNERIVELAKNIDQISEMKISSRIPGFQIIIINDVGNAFAPVLDLTLFDAQVLISKNNIMTQITVIPHLQAS